MKNQTKEIVRTETPAVDATGSIRLIREIRVRQWQFAIAGADADGTEKLAVRCREYRRSDPRISDGSPRASAITLSLL